jgi:hypothetical protein
MSAYPRRIDNGAGEQLTFVAVGRDERGEFLEVRNVVALGAGPPMHVHRLQEEAGTVERGRLGYVIEGEPERSAGPGDSVAFAPGGGAPLPERRRGGARLHGDYPPARQRRVLTEVFASTRRAGGKRPGVFDAAYLSHRYAGEFAITAVPAPVRRFVFPVIVAAGRLLGRHRRFAGAPEPLAPPPR